MIMSLGVKEDMPIRYSHGERRKDLSRKNAWSIKERRMSVK